MSDASLRIDKWLWHARFFKSRTLASAFCVSGRLRVNSALVNKAHYPLRAGDVLTFAKGAQVRVVRVLVLGVRRGPATEARTLYEDVEVPEERGAGPDTVAAPAGERDRGSGRPTKADRRAIDRLRDKP